MKQIITNAIKVGTVFFPLALQAKLQDIQQTSWQKQFAQLTPSEKATHLSELKAQAKGGSSHCVINGQCIPTAAGLASSELKALKDLSAPGLGL